MILVVPGSLVPGIHFQVLAHRVEIYPRCSLDSDARATQQWAGEVGVSWFIYNVVYLWWSEEVILFDEACNNFDFGCDDILYILDDIDLLASFDGVLFILNLVLFTLGATLIVAIFGSIKFLGFYNDVYWVSITSAFILNVTISDGFLEGFFVARFLTSQVLDGAEDGSQYDIIIL